MANFLLDREFLAKVNKHHVKEYWAAILALDFETERPLARLEGKVASGSMNITAKSQCRRTGSLKLLFDKETQDITNIDNLISIDKKISLSIGITNPFFHIPQYHEYGDILWFKQGTFVITKANSTINAQSASVSCDIADKMSLLNGTCGGTIPASTSFHEQIIIDKDDNITTEYPLIAQIIRECVHHFGGEHYSNIVVNDVPDVGRQVVTWVGSDPINFTEIGAGTSFIIGPPPIPGFPRTYYNGNDIGYLETPLTYPGELILKAGSTVTGVLDEIVKTLGNFEYFYDVEGVFHFQQIQNYQATGNTPFNIDGVADGDFQSLYFPRFTDDQFLNEFLDTELVTSVSFNPNYSNIKNDFVCWGTRNAKDSSAAMVRYHLAIDKRPELITELDAQSRGTPSAYSLCLKDIYEIRDEEGNIIRYQDSIITNPGEVLGELVAPSLKTTFSTLDESYWFNWREELYRQALLAYGSSTRGSYYDEELRTEWRNIYDPASTFARDGADSFEIQWNDYFGNTVPWGGYRVEVSNAPEKIRYWLDLIDTGSTLGKYSVNRIGRRTKVEENSKIAEVYAQELNDIVFLETTSDAALAEKRKYYVSIGQSFCQVTPDVLAYFKVKNSFGTCYESVRQMMYTHLMQNASVSITSLPIFYMDVNKIVKFNFPDFSITGDYIINQISWQIGSNATMNISANEAMVIA